MKIVIPDHIQYEIYKRIESKYFNGVTNPEHKDLLSVALNDAYTKKCELFSISFMFLNHIRLYPLIILVKPYINRQIRSTMTKNAEKESIEVFAKNVKQLLLLKPVKGKRILGIDPGFRNGCKLALISEQNDVLQTDCIYPHTKKEHLMIYEHKVINMLKKNR